MTRKELFPHQVKGVEYGTARKRGYFYITMRGGKTLTSLRTIEALNAYPVLILTTMSIFQTWKTQILGEGYAPEDVCIIKGTKKKKQELLNKMAKFTILNYESVKALGALDGRKWGGIIYDESYRLGNMGSGIVRYCLHRARHYQDTPSFMLSGSPASESPINFVPQYFICDGHFMGIHSMAQYLHKYWRYCPFSHKWKPNRKAHLEEIRQYVAETAYCYVAKLSDKHYSKYCVELNKKQKAALDWAFKKTTRMDDVAKVMGKTSTLGKMLYVMYENMVCAGIDPETKETISTEKQKAVIQMYKDRPRPMLVLSQYTTPIYEMVELARKHKIPCGYIDGSVSREDAHKLEKLFNSGKIQILVAQVKVVKFGLDFKVSDTTIYLNNSFSLDDRAQSEQRTSNLTKEGGVEIIDMCTEDGIDYRIVERLQDKEEKAKSFIDNRIIAHLRGRGAIL